MNEYLFTEFVGLRGKQYAKGVKGQDSTKYSVKACKINQFGNRSVLKVM